MLLVGVPEIKVEIYDSGFSRVTEGHDILYDRGAGPLHKTQLRKKKIK